MNSIKTEIPGIISQLNNLLVANIDAKNGYKEALEKADNAELKSFMVSQMKQRANFASELSEIIRSLGGMPNEQSSFSSEIHRFWIDLKSVISKNTNPSQLDKGLMKECIRGEKLAVDDYTKVLESTNIALPVRKLLQQHRDRIVAAYQFLQNFDL